MFSLIVTTRNRVEELERLLASLEAQTYKAFEVIVVDQNEDGRVLDTLARHCGLKIRHLHSGPGCSHGRNIGFAACEGDIVSFPDDDCWYPGELLADVSEWFRARPDYDGLLTGVRSLEDKAMTPKFPPGEGVCNKRSILRCAVAWNMFFRRPAAETVGVFREDMGPGAASPYQSGEDLDYAVRALEQGVRLWYAPSLAVHHPYLKAGPRLVRTTYNYALGVGRVWRLHGYPWTYSLGDIVFRSLAGALFKLFQGDFQRARLYAIRAKGEFQGYRRDWGGSQELGG